MGTFEAEDLALVVIDNAILAHDLLAAREIHWLPLIKVESMPVDKAFMGTNDIVSIRASTFWIFFMFSGNVRMIRWGLKLLSHLSGMRCPSIHLLKSVPRRVELHIGIIVPLVSLFIILL